jgi:hypothetical protein
MNKSLDHFKNWATKKLETINKSSNFEVQILPAEDPICVILDVFNARHSGRITYRLDGHCDVEIIDNLTEQQQMYKYISDVHSKNLDIELHDFFAYMFEV